VIRAGECDTWQQVISTRYMSLLVWLSALLNHKPKLAGAVGFELVRDELIGQYIQLLRDNEAEVRTAAATQISGRAVYEHETTAA